MISNFPSPGSSTSNTHSTSADDFDNPSKPSKLKSSSKSLSDKRAEQNRKAQRIFRQKKKEYLKNLEEIAAQMPVCQAQIEALLNENQRLRALLAQNEASSPESGSMTPPLSTSASPVPETHVFSAPSFTNMPSSGDNKHVYTSESINQPAAPSRISHTSTSNSNSSKPPNASPDNLYLLPPAFGGSTQVEMNELLASEVFEKRDIFDSYHVMQTQQQFIEFGPIAPPEPVHDEDTDDELVFKRVHTAVTLKPECKKLKDEVVNTICDLMERTTCKDERFENVPTHRLKKFWSRLLIYASMEAFENCENKTQKERRDALQEWLFSQENVMEQEMTDQQPQMQGPQADGSKVSPFGTVLGVTDGGVEVCSCDYKSADQSKYPSRDSYQMYYNGVYTGYRYQCVELARRYLLANHGVIFESIPMAYDIFNLKSVKRVKDNKLFVMSAHSNESKILPTKGSLLIWDPHGEFKVTGHVAVVVAVGSDHVDIVEQNVDDAIWPEGQPYSRRLKARVQEDGTFHIMCTFEDTRVLGWMNLHLDQEYHPEEIQVCKKTDLEKIIFEIPETVAEKKWLDLDDPAIALFAKLHGSNLVEKGSKTGTFFSLPERSHCGLLQATEELHKMFSHATEAVLHNDEMLRTHFRIPEKLWPKLRKSWYTRHRDIIAGRFDFSLSDSGVKVYEYNADSASCLMECGLIQDLWARAAGIGHVGRNSSDGLFQKLVETWKKAHVGGILHLFHDEGDEETYHTLYMKSAAEKAGLKCKVVLGTTGLSWTLDGKVQDDEGQVIKTVWKTWSWQTILSQLETKKFYDFIADESKVDKNSPPELFHVLLSDSIKVYEPFWTLIPACKAILPVLYQMYPESPFLLKSSFELTDEIKKGGYVSKPVTGRGGGNVSLFDSHGKLIAKSPGKWENDKEVYQELCPLPNYDGDNVQVCCWTVCGQYGGTVLRVDESHIIAYESNVYALRIVNDE